MDICMRSKLDLGQQWSKTTAAVCPFVIIEEQNYQGVSRGLMNVC